MGRCNLVQRTIWIIVIMACSACGPSELPAFANPPPDDNDDGGLIDDRDAAVR